MRLTADMAQRVLAELETAEAASAVNALCREHVGDALVRGWWSWPIARQSPKSGPPPLSVWDANCSGSHQSPEKTPHATLVDLGVAAIVVGMSRVHGS